MFVIHQTDAAEKSIIFVYKYLICIMCCVIIFLCDCVDDIVQLLFVMLYSPRCCHNSGNVQTVETNKREFFSSKVLRVNVIKWMLFWSFDVRSHTRFACKDTDSNGCEYFGTSNNAHMVCAPLLGSKWVTTLIIEVAVIVLGTFIGFLMFLLHTAACLLRALMNIISPFVHSRVSINIIYCIY